jgi:hypothetical protein
MRLLFANDGIEIWEVREAYGLDFYVYGILASGDPRICPSLAMAYEVAAR